MPATQPTSTTATVTTTAFSVDIGGVFDGRHRSEIRPLGPDACELVHSEHLSGMLVPFFKKLLTGPTPDAVAMNNALKERSERAN